MSAPVPNIRAARIIQGRTLEDVAVEAGISRETVRRVEIGEPVRDASRHAVLAALDMTDEFDSIYPERVSEEPRPATTLERLVIYMAAAFAIGVTVGMGIASVVVATA